MANHKVFTRTHLTAAVAPLLYGHDPAELDRVVDHILGGQLVVPLLASGAIHERAYATVEVLATEQAIAESIDRLADRPGPALPERDVTDAVLAKGDEIGHRLPPGQWDVVAAVCSSGRAVEVVVGVAGSGKTTALDAASAALGRHGYRVLGTSTSGQAARTLGDEAHIESRTIASLLWRLEHRQIAFDPRTVVILDEAGMTADRTSPGSSPTSKPPDRSSSSSATPASSPRSDPAAHSPRSWSATPTSSPPWTRTSANATPPNAAPSPSSATGTSTKPSTGTSPAAAPP